MNSQSFIASANPYPSSQPYHLRRLDYLTILEWDDETHYLNVKVNDVEVEFNHYNPSIIARLNQPEIGDKIILSIEEIELLP